MTASTFADGRFEIDMSGQAVTYAYNEADKHRCVYGHAWVKQEKGGDRHDEESCNSLKASGKHTAILEVGAVPNFRHRLVVVVLVAVVAFAVFVVAVFCADVGGMLISRS